MGKQHRSFSKDMEMLAEAYNESSLLGGKHLMHTGNPEVAATALAHDDGYNSPEEAAEHRTVSDQDLIKWATDTQDGTLKPDAYEALIDVYNNDPGEVPLKADTSGANKDPGEVPHKSDTSGAVWDGINAGQ